MRGHHIATFCCKIFTLKIKVNFVWLNYGEFGRCKIVHTSNTHFQHCAIELGDLEMSTGDSLKTSEREEISLFLQLSWQYIIAN